MTGFEQLFIEMEPLAGGLVVFELDAPSGAHPVLLICMIISHSRGAAAPSDEKGCLDRSWQGQREFSASCGIADEDGQVH